MDNDMDISKCLASIQAEVIAAKMDNNVRYGLRWSVRNRLVKKALACVFGYRNVKVRQSYTWIDITIITERPHTGSCSTRYPEIRYYNYDYCNDCSLKKRAVESTAWSVIKQIGLYDEISRYTDDMGVIHEECSIQVLFNDEVRRH